MTTSSLLDPSSVAVVGASTDPAKAGYSLFENVARFGGDVVGIGRRDGQLHGRPVVAGLDGLDQVDGLDGRVDLAVLAVPPEPSVAMVEELDRRGVGTAIVCAGGFAEAGADGAALQQRLTDATHQGSIRVLGPNTSGIVVPGRGLFCSFVPAVRDLPSGRLGVVAQSGGVAHTIAFACGNEGVGVSAMVGAGNGADLRLPELVAMVGELPETQALAVHVEGLPDGTDLLDVIDELHHHLPVIAIKAGRSDVDHLATSHTGALTGDWATAAAMLGDAGAVVVGSLTDLVDAAKALTAHRLAPHAARGRNPGVGVVTGQAGPGILLVDRLQQLGVDVPPLDHETARRVEAILPDLTHRQNPVDTGRPGETFAEMAGLVAGTETIDLLVLFALLEPGAVDFAELAADARARSVPTLLGTGGPRPQLDEVLTELAGSLPVYDLPDRVATGAWALCRDAEQRGRRDTPAPAASHPDPGGLPSPPLTEAEAKAVLTEVGLSSPPHIVCRGHAAAHAALDRLGGPVAVKVAEASIAHKARVDGVHLDVDDPDRFQRALERIDAGVGTATMAPSYLVERMAPPGIDVIVGARLDPNWGTVLVVGLGGSDVEDRRRVGLFRAPVATERLARDLSRAGVVGPGALPARAGEAVARAANTIAALVECWPAADTIELNPLRIVGDEVLALDALVGKEGSTTP